MHTKKYSQFCSGRSLFLFSTNRLIDLEIEIVSLKYSNLYSDIYSGILRFGIELMRIEFICKTLRACSGFGFAHAGCRYETTNILGFWDRWHACGRLPLPQRQVDSTKPRNSPDWRVDSTKPRNSPILRVLYWMRCVVRNLQNPENLGGFVTVRNSTYHDIFGQLAFTSSGCFDKHWTSSTLNNVLNDWTLGTCHACRA